MDRFPLIITLGGMLLGWIAGGMMVTDPFVVEYTTPHMPYIKYIAEAIGALLVLAIGLILARNQKKRGAQTLSH